MNWGSIYYAPEKLGIEIVASVEHEPDWNFDITLFVRHDDRYYVVQDSGCSCPTPFEDVKGLEDLTRVRTTGEVQAFIKPFNYPTDDALSFMAKVREVLPA